MAELKPCPFCGGEAEIVPHRFYNERHGRFETQNYGVECSSCHTSGWLWWETEQRAIEAWNRRAGADK